MFTCVNCGNQVQELFKKYSPTVLKLMHCEKCNQVADKYIEYDPVIVMIDLVLLNERAYRHILYNSPFQSHWRLAIVLVLFEAYSSWATKKNEEALNSINMYHYDLFEGEGSFYFMCIQAILGSAILFLFTYFLTWLRWKIHPLDKPKNYNNIILWKALVLSNCGKFLIIPSLIWGEIGTQIHSFFILGYIFISQLKTYAVVCNTRKAGAGVIIFFGLILKLYVSQIFNKIKL